MINRKFKIAILSLGMAFPLMGTAQQINPMTEAVLRNYNEILAENPQDYITLFDRANQYFAIGDYDRALSDIDMAIEYTPAKEVEYRNAEYSLRADILMAKKEYGKAVEATQSALELNPGSLADIYKLGNLYLLENNPSEALKAFQRLQRENPRSQEAFYGMAKANVMLGNKEDADKLIREIEALGKNSYVTYCRIGDLYADMGRNREATANYLTAATMTENPRPLESIKFLSGKDFDGVMASIDSFITASPDNVVFPYIKAVTAYDNGAYDLCEEAYKVLIDQVTEDAPALYRMLALSQKALNKPSEALTNIKFAENIAKGNEYILADKADILLATDPNQALTTAEEALAINPNLELAMLIAAKAAIMEDDGKKGLEYLNNVIITNPANVEALLLRGYLNEEVIKDGKTAVLDYSRAGNQKADDASTMAMIALGKSKAGKKLDAEGIINEAISKSSGDKDGLYMIAVYYAQTGNLEKAKEYRDKAIASGYKNKYNLTANKEPLLNLLPIQHLK